MKDIGERTLAAFKVEYADHLTHIRAELARLEGGTVLPGEGALFDMYRRAHSLKGAARAAGLEAIENLAHEMESLFSLVRSGERPLDHRAVTIIQAVVDGIEDWMVGLGSGGDQIDIRPVLRDMQTFLRSGDSGEPGTIPAGAGDLPEVETIRDAGRRSETAPAASAGRPDLDDLRINTKKLNAILRSASNLVLRSEDGDKLSAALARAEQTILDVQQMLRADEAVSLVPASIGATHLDEHRTGNLRSTAIRQLSSVVSEIAQVRQHHRTIEWNRRQVSEALQADIVRARMVSLDAVFGSFGKMVRDIAREEGKDVELRLYGAEIEVDRPVIEMLKDPVMHLLRNAVHHGIEPRQVRVAAGKPAAGRISMRFSLRGNRLEIAISDDGAGVNFDLVRQQVVKSGLASADYAAEASDSELLNYIGLPGFSTANQVNRIAGRGMGLAVVNDAVLKLGGALSIDSTGGKGTIFRIDAPVSIAIQKLLRVKLGDDRFALPADAVERVETVVASDVLQAADEPKLVDGTGLLDLVPLGQALGRKGAGIRSHDGRFEVIVLRHLTDRVAVAVDEVPVLFDAMVVDIGLPGRMMSFVSGGVLVEENSVICVLNPAAIVRAVRSGRRGTLTLSEEPAEAAVPTLLIVDDSFTTRTLEKVVLEAHGYRVRLAVDGVDALVQLRDGDIDLIITDIEMPNMDGWSLLQNLRSDGAHADLPVIVVTSREDAADRKRGMTLGASAYIVKKHFDQRELLEVIDHLL